ncbi:MAG: hypothetical protein AAF570_09515 [Bacteroidota bacterium]
MLRFPLTRILLFLFLASATLLAGCAVEKPLRLKGKVKADISDHGLSSNAIEGYILTFSHRRKLGRERYDIKELRLYLEELPYEGGKVDIATSGSYGRYREGGQVLVYDSRVCTGTIVFYPREEKGKVIQGRLDLTFHSPIIQKTDRENRRFQDDFSVQFK